ncbi:uncharacterized protein [Euphorbia lathyris]|uniref:uncharacterized protein n=1 Tax=Euphorbia lathyris TaxID=212925 RepID=UPI0033132F31
MRIRKRKVPFPLSSLSPVPLSDPPFAGLLQLHSNPEADQPNHPIGDGYSSKQEEDKFLCKQDEDGGGEGEEKIGNDCRKESSLGAKTPTSVLQVADEKALIPMKQKKKRRVGEEKEKKMKRKRGRGGAVMEGSRCSRVNGRGWRCCQQTLVGYSLCEHHLGKGRLRSITTVPNKDKLVSVSGDEQQQQPLLMSNKNKKHKLGMVKARSISSLLGQR